jgi:hypothetical protein
MAWFRDIVRPLWYGTGHSARRDRGDHSASHRGLHAAVRSIKEEALGQSVMHGERGLSSAIHQYLSHYHTERHHQGLGNQRIAPEGAGRDYTGRVVRRKHLGGLLSYSHREAA